MNSLIDLSHPLNQGMPVFPGTELPEIYPVATIDKDGFREKHLSFTSHTGTHIDAPAHILRDGKFLDDFPITHFTGKGIVLDLKQVNSNGISYLDEILQRSDVPEFILFRTGWSSHWGTTRYYEDFEVPDTPIIAHLMHYNLKGIGLDVPSVDPINSKALPNHHTLLNKDVLILENLTNLIQLPDHPFILYCLPLKLTKADGAPVRAVASV